MTVDGKGEYVTGGGDDPGIERGFGQSKKVSRQDVWIGVLVLILFRDAQRAMCPSVLMNDCWIEVDGRENRQARESAPKEGDATDEPAQYDVLNKSVFGY